MRLQARGWPCLRRMYGTRCRLYATDSRTWVNLAGTSRKVADRVTALPRRAVDNLAPARRVQSGRAAMCCRAPTLAEVVIMLAVEVLSIATNMASVASPFAVAPRASASVECRRRRAVACSCAWPKPPRLAVARVHGGGAFRRAAHVRCEAGASDSVRVTGGAEQNATRDPAEQKELWWKVSSLDCPLPNRSRRRLSSHKPDASPLALANTT